MRTTGYFNAKGWFLIANEVQGNYQKIRLLIGAEPTPGVEMAPHMEILESLRERSREFRIH